MAVIPSGVENLVHSILSYMYTIISILFFVKIIQTVMGIGGFGGSKGGKDNKTTKPEVIKDDKIDKKEKPEKTLEEIEDDRISKDKFDPRNPCYLKILVSDEDDNPLQGVHILIRPAFARKRKYWLLPVMLGGPKNKDTWRKYKGGMITNADGYCPSRDESLIVGSGTVNIKVTKHGWKNIYIKQDWMTHVELPANKEKLLIFTMAKKGEKVGHYEPHIIDMYSNKNDGTLHTKAIIK